MSDSLPPLSGREHWPRELALEHARAREFIITLRALCDAPAGQTSCERCLLKAERECHCRLSPLLDEVAAFMFMHFINEERMMKSVAYSTDAPDLHEGHVEDHANLCEALFQVISTIDEDSEVVVIRRLQALLHRLAHEHIPRFDAPFLSRLQYL